MYRVKEAIVVEGAYDKIKLSGFIDAPIIVTGGFSVYSSPQKLALIQKMAESTGIVILTDSDSAGFRIRSFIKQSVRKGRVLHAYVPDIRGKEKRKKAAGKEGLLGVEGMKEDVILDALVKAGAEINGSADAPKSVRAISKADMMSAGLAGGENARELRCALAHELGLPAKISANMLLDVLNRLMSRDEFFALAAELKLIEN